MGTTFYVCDATEEYVFDIDVESPGHGYLHLTRLGPDGRCDVVERQRLFQVLDAVTSAVLAGEDADLPGLYRISAQRCRELLPQLQRAVLLAAAGADRFERLDPDPGEDLSPEPPLCANCGLGSPYAGKVTISELCVEFGHTPFGRRQGWRWEAAQEAYQRDLSWWEATRQR